MHVCSGAGAGPGGDSEGSFSCRRVNPFSWGKKPQLPLPLCVGGGKEVEEVHCLDMDGDRRTLPGGLEGLSAIARHLWTLLHLTEEEAAIHFRLGENFALLSSLSAAPRSG